MLDSVCLSSKIPAAWIVVFQKLFSQRLKVKGTFECIFSVREYLTSGSSIKEDYSHFTQLSSMEV